MHFDCLQLYPQQLSMQCLIDRVVDFNYSLVQLLFIEISLKRSIDCGVDSGHSSWFSKIDDCGVLILVNHDLSRSNLTFWKQIFINDCEWLNEIIVNAAPASDSASSNATAYENALNEYSVLFQQVINEILFILNNHTEKKNTFSNPHSPE